LVEDHQLTRLGLKVALHRTKDIHVIGEASNGQEAVAMAEKLKPDVILMDVGMPVMDGIQAASQIVSSDSSMKIIMLTQHDNDADVMASLAAGASGYCLKDVEPDRLYTAIRSVSTGDVWLDSAVASRVLKHYSANAALIPTPHISILDIARGTTSSKKIMTTQQRLALTDQLQNHCHLASLK
jgi:DNA-binding NarL/FixJ family response regulator